jgi:hypothetical protein
MPSAYDLAFETPTERTARNLAAREAAKSSAPFPKTRICGLCDHERPFLMAVKKLHGQGGLFACSGCVLELLGKSNDL